MGAAEIDRRLWRGAAAAGWTIETARQPVYIAPGGLHRFHNERLARQHAQAPSTPWRAQEAAAWLTVRVPEGLVAGNRFLVRAPGNGKVVYQHYQVRGRRAAREQTAR